MLRKRSHGQWANKEPLCFGLFYKSITKTPNSESKEHGIWRRVGLSLFTIPAGIAGHLEKVMGTSFGLSMTVITVFIRVVGMRYVVPRRMVVWELDCFEQ